MSIQSIWSQTAQIIPTVLTAAVIKVVDGDTIEVQQGNRVVKVRLIGINTPESVDPRKTVECYGYEASEFLKKLLENKSVMLESDPTQDNQDKYGRLLRYVYVDNELVNLKLVADGFAHEYTYESPYLKQTEFKEAEKRAREKKLGLWNQETCPVTGHESLISPTSVKTCAIKGNISNGVKIYHLPMCRDYNKTQINLKSGERWFCDEREAVASGWRRSENCL